MGVLRLASDETKRIDLGDGDYLEVRSDLSKKDFNRLLRNLPESFTNEEKVSAADADDFTTSVFDLLVVGWSLDVPADRENYEKLSRESASVIDAKLMEVFNELTPSQEERSKSKGSK